jgi:hypothetical protein
MPIFVTEIDSPEKALKYKMNMVSTVSWLVCYRVSVDFNEIKHYFNTGEHLAKPSVVDRVQAVRNHLTWMDGKENA